MGFEGRVGKASQRVVVVEYTVIGVSSEPSSCPGWSRVSLPAAGPLGPWQGCADQSHMSCPEGIGKPGMLPVSYCHFVLEIDVN